VKAYGADALRVFEMFLGPLEASKPWSTKGIEGVSRFLNRGWRMIANEDGTISAEVQDMPMTPDEEFVLHSTIKKVGEDIESLSFNTAVSQMMIFVNEFTKTERKPREAMEKFVLCLASFAPHIAEELWQILGHKKSVVLEAFPAYDENKIVKRQIEFVVQVNSKIRGKLMMAPDLTQEQVESVAKDDDNVIRFLEGKTIRKIIFVQNKLINFIVG
jgi:leucyl-tRNA synthetase